MPKRSQGHIDEPIDSMGEDPLKRDRRYDDAGNPVSRDRLIERVSEQDDGSPCRLPKV